MHIYISGADSTVKGDVTAIYYDSLGAFRSSIVYRLTDRLDMSYRAADMHWSPYLKTESNRDEHRLLTSTIRSILHSDADTGGYKEATFYHYEPVPEK